MPRAKPQGTRMEQYRATRRLDVEVKKRELKQRQFAQLMEEAGCPISPPWLTRVRRRVRPQPMTVDEFAAVAQIFNIPLDEIFGLRDPLLTKRANKVLERLEAAKEEITQAVGHLETAIGSARELLADGEQGRRDDGDQFAFRATEVASGVERAYAELVHLYQDAVNRTYLIDDDGPAHLHCTGTQNVQDGAPRLRQRELHPEPNRVQRYDHGQHR